jgi:hypothetical protein
MSNLSGNLRTIWASVIAEVKSKIPKTIVDYLFTGFLVIGSAVGGAFWGAYQTVNTFGGEVSKIGIYVAALEEKTNEDRAYNAGKNDELVKQVNEIKENQDKTNDKLDRLTLLLIESGLVK